MGQYEIKICNKVNNFILNKIEKPNFYEESLFFFFLLVYSLFQKHLNTEQQRPRESFLFVKS